MLHVIVLLLLLSSNIYIRWISIKFEAYIFLSKNSVPGTHKHEIKFCFNYICAKWKVEIRR